MFYSFFRILLGVILGLAIAKEVKSDTLPEISAKSWIVATTSGEMITGVNVNEIRPVASITKLMTVMVVLDANQPMDEVLTKRLFRKPLTRRDLIDLALIKSNNDAARILCEKYPAGLRACVQAMNEKSVALGMTNTTFTDPTGLYNTNTSNVLDLVKMVIHASTYPIVVADSNRNSMTIANGKKSNVFYNTNPMAGVLEFLVSKTGFISQAGGCIAVMQQTVNGIRVAIVLGSKNTKTRIAEFQEILKSFS